MDIASSRILNAAGAADFVGWGQRGGAVDQRFNRALIRVRQLIAIRPEQLDAIIFIRVVACGNHHAQIRAHGTRQHGHRRRWHRPNLHNIHANRGESGDQRIFNHIARKACILADDDPVTMVAAHEMRASCHADFHRHFCCHCRGIGASPDAIGSEIFAAHPPALLNLI